MSTSHPTLVQFKRKLESVFPNVNEANAFDKWRQKQESGTANRVEADQLWEEYLRRRDSGLRVSPQGTRSAQERRDAPRATRGTSQPIAAERNPAVSADLLGSPFTNPYTFVPFPASAPLRRAPTPLTIDELERERVSGVLEIELETLSPLLTCSPKPTDGAEGKHKVYSVLSVGDDVIVPATGVRGALRSLMSILLGGTLGYIDDNVWLTQGRDMPLGPRGKESGPDVPLKAFLARVVEAGSTTRSGTILLGDTRLAKADELERLLGQDRVKRLRPTSKRADETVWVDEGLTQFSSLETPECPWQVRFSGRPINAKGKREGLFRGDPARTLELPPSFWAAYAGRHAHGVVGELRRGDLVWLRPSRADVTEINRVEDIDSIQWARWGRRGERLLDVVREHHPALVPDSFNRDGKVDEITDLFGQVPMEPADRNGASPAGPFAGRIRCSNLVFEGACKKGVEKRVRLAPLARPHPGCAAFYRDADGPDEVANRGLPLRGYKVYRTSSQLGEKAPWLFKNQGIYSDSGLLQSDESKSNKTCDLLKHGQVGRLRISFRALSERELALLIATCCVDWRLGGGKPLGLGHCRVTVVKVRLLTEQASAASPLAPGKEIRPVPQDHRKSLAELPDAMRRHIEPLLDRFDLWRDSQMPVERLLYPRAASGNQNRIQRGGHVWFQRHATLRRSGDGFVEGLQSLWLAGELQQKAGGRERMTGQMLPKEVAGLLFGHDLIDPAGSSSQERDRRTRYTILEPFDPARHATGTERSGGNQSQNRETRRHDRDER
jgi:hypothetical protein